jgi:hypothetical protein
MRRRLAAAALVVAVPVALVPVLAQAKSTMVIRLVSITTSHSVKEEEPAGPSRGDTLVTTSRLENAVAQFGRAKGAVVGRDRGTFRFTDSVTGVADGVATLPGGTVRFHGVLRESDTGTIPVTGGSGRYTGARGTLTITNLGQGTLRASNVYRLTLP